MGQLKEFMMVIVTILIFFPGISIMVASGAGGGFILLVISLVIGLDIYVIKEANRKRAEKKAYEASPEGIAAAAELEREKVAYIRKTGGKLPAEPDPLSPTERQTSHPAPPLPNTVGENRAPAYWMIGGGIVILIILIATQG